MENSIPKMTDTSCCPICTEKYTSVIRTKISCGYCPQHACKPCVSRYLLTQVVDAHCMNCRTGWNREFIDTNLTKTFRAGPWRDHKKQLIMNREKASLPVFQKYAAAKKKMNEVAPLRNEAHALYTEGEAKKFAIHNRIAAYPALIMKKGADVEDLKLKHKADAEMISTIHIDILEKTINYHRLFAKYQYHSNIYNDINGYGGETEKKEFIMKCVKDGCRGFLSQAYKCELCSTYACKDCLVAKKEKNDEAHVCKKDDVESVALIRKETRPCPKCGIRISKIDGCDQMWCTADGCGTAFSWNSNKIISGVVHNPHYYEWLRRNNNGEAPRPMGEVLCGGVPHYISVFTPLRSLNMNALFPKVFLTISNIHRSLTDIEQVRLAQYTPVRDALMFKDIHTEYLLNEINEEDWVQRLFTKENAIEKKQQIGLVIQTFFNAGSDLMRSLLVEITNLLKKKVMTVKYILNTEDMGPIIANLEELNKLRKYINESLIVLGKNIMAAVPTFDESWEFHASSRVGKTKAAVIAAPVIAAPVIAAIPT